MSIGDYKSLGVKLGEGLTAKAKLGYCPKRKVKVCLKILKKRFEKEETLYNEPKVMMKLDHPNIIKCLDF